MRLPGSLSGADISSQSCSGQSLDQGMFPEARMSSPANTNVFLAGIECRVMGIFSGGAEIVPIPVHLYHISATRPAC